MGHPYLIALFQQHLVVFTQSHTEDDGGHVLEAMNPLLSLAALATHIKHAVKIVSTWTLDASLGYLLYAQLTHCETCFVYTSGLGSRS